MGSGIMNRNRFLVVGAIAFGLLCPATHAAEIHDAVKAGNLAEVKRLIADGVNIDEQDSDGQTALHIAVIEKRMEIVPWLLEQHASVHAAMRNGDTPLHVAGRHGRPRIAAMLIEAGADINA